MRERGGDSDEREGEREYQWPAYLWWTVWWRRWTAKREGGRERRGETEEARCAVSGDRER